MMCSRSAVLPLLLACPQWSRALDAALPATPVREHHPTHDDRSNVTCNSSRGHQAPAIAAQLPHNQDRRCALPVSIMTKVCQCLTTAAPAASTDVAKSHHEPCCCHLSIACGQRAADSPAAAIIGVQLPHGVGRGHHLCMTVSLGLDLSAHK